MRAFKLLGIGLLAACLACACVRSATSGPKPGDWAASIEFTANGQPDTVSLLFTINQKSTVIDSYSLYDFTTGVSVTGGFLPLGDAPFQIDAASNGYAYHLTGQFTAPDRVEGTYAFEYPGYWSVTGTWSGAPQR